MVVQIKVAYLRESNCLYNDLIVKQINLLFYLKDTTFSGLDLMIAESSLRLLINCISHEFKEYLIYFL